MINKITGKNVSCNLHHLKDCNGKLVTQKDDIAALLGTNFEKCSSSSNYRPEFQKIKKDHERKKINFKTTINFKYNKKFTMRDLKRSLKKAKNSAFGPDLIHYEILKHLPLQTLHILLDIINDVWQNGTFPESWREALIVAIPKPGRDLHDPGNYRPIALTSCICKTVERMVNERLIWYLEKNKILSQEQCGYRAHRSTIDHLVRLETFIREAFINNEHLVAVFFDLQKAYDTTWKHGIINDLHNIGLRGCLPKFISNFLDDRVFKVQYGTTMSDYFSQEEGVPQGAILSTTLFNIKINNITRALESNTECSLYVDDFLICYRSNNMETIERKLQLSINKLSDWTLKNGFTFSRSKTVAMHFCNKQKTPDDPCLTLNGSPIKFVKETKFLGLVWDTKLNFRAHINHLKSRCAKALNLLKSLANTDWGADCATLLKLYRSLIRSKLDYGSIVYGSARDSYIKVLDPIHNQGLRLCLGVLRTSPAESIYVEAHEPSLADRRKKLALQYYFKLKANPTNPAHQLVFHPNYIQKFRDRPQAIAPFGVRMKWLAREANLNLDNIAINTVPNTPVWNAPEIKVLFDLSVYNKFTTLPDFFKSTFLELREEYLKYYAIYIQMTPSGMSGWPLP